MRRPLLVILPLLALVAAATLGARPALAADARPVELPLASGKSLTGVVESADAKEVVLRIGPESVRRVPWSQLQPLGVYRVKAALAPPADGKARLRLAELAIELGLHVEARVELEKALALGAIEKKAFQAVLMKAEQDAVEVGVQRARRAAEAGDWDQALQTARELKLHFSGAPNAGAIDRLLKDLLAQIQDLKAQSERDRKELERVKIEAQRNKEILRRSTKATALIEKGREEATNAEGARAKGNVTRARKYAEAADKAFTDARRNLGRLRRILKPEDPVYREVLQRLNDLDIEQFKLLFATAWFFWEGRIYSKAEEWAARASYIDPVHPELLDLREQLRESRIRYRFSDVTNARPIIR